MAKDQGSKALVIARSNLPNRRDPQSVRAALSDRLLFSEALEVVGAMLRGYPNGGQQAGGSYQGALAEALTRYPRCIVAYAGDVTKGVPATTRFLPTPADVIAWCERELEEWRRIVDRDDHERAIRDEMKQREKGEADLATARAARPTLQQMQEKYGPNWGLSAAEKQDLIIKAARDDTMKQANTFAFELECKHAGIDPKTASVSPSLARLLSQGETDEARMRRAERLGREIDRVAAQAAE